MMTTTFTRQMAAILMAALVLMTGCAKTSTTTPPPPAGSQLVADVTLAVTASEVLVQALPNIPANVKTEVQAGGTILNTALACVQAAVKNNNGAEPQTGLAVTNCGASVDISKFSAQAQVYLSDFKAALQVLLNYFNVNTTTVTTTEVAQVSALTARTAKVQAKVAK